jgi:uncharacterized membrane protein
VGVAYTVEELAPLPGHQHSAAGGINSQGDVAGTSQSVRPVLWVGSTPTDLGRPPGSRLAEVTDVNDGRTVVGNAWIGNETQGFVWKAGVFTMIPSPLPPQYFRYVYVTGVNNGDVAVGYYFDRSGHSHAFRYTAGGGLVDIHPPGYGSSIAVAISERGVIVGGAALGDAMHAARWSATDAFTDLGTLGGLLSAVAQSVNTAGTIVGWASPDPMAPVPFLWSSRTEMIALADSGIAYGVSDAGRVIGQDARGAVTWRRNRPAQVLPALPGGRAGAYSVPDEVNRCGTIAGTAELEGAGVPGQMRAVRWRIAACDR